MYLLKLPLRKRTSLGFKLKKNKFPNAFEIEMTEYHLIFMYYDPSSIDLIITAFKSLNLLSRIENAFKFQRAI